MTSSLRISPATGIINDTVNTILLSYTMISLREKTALLVDLKGKLSSSKYKVEKLI